MPDKQKARPFSASRQRRQLQRSSSLNSIQTVQRFDIEISGPSAFISGIDLRTPKQKIEDLKQEIIDTKDDATPEKYLNQLILMQVYTNLEYGDSSIESARAYINLSKYYLNRKANYLPQAYFHAQTAREILERLKIKPNDDELTENLVAYDIYLILIKCVIHSKQVKIKSKNILSIEKLNIENDLKLLESYLGKLEHLMKTKSYEKMYMDYLFTKFDKILLFSKKFDQSIYKLIDDIFVYIEKYFTNDTVKRQIDLYLRSGSYLINYDQTIQEGLKYYRKGVELANEQEKKQSSIAHKHQLANAILQRSIARVRTGQLTDDLENDFQQAILLYKQPDNEVNKNVLKVIDEFATFYMKAENYQEALNVLCESMPDKIQIFGDFSEEVMQTESRIGAIYLREGECLNAAEHLQTCLELQEFVYGPNDSRTVQTRDTVQMLKKDPMVSRTFFARTHDGKLQDRPEFRIRNKVSHDEEDLRLFQPLTKKPPISSKT